MNAAVTSSALLVVTFALVIVGAYLARFFLLAKWTDDMTKWLQQQQSPDVSTVDRDIVLLCPLYAEDRWISTLVDQISDLEYPTDHLRIVFVLNEADPTRTAEILSETLAHSAVGVPTETILVTGENKAQQLNAAMEWLGSARPEWFQTDTYVGVYDVDTRIDQKTLCYIGNDEDAPTAYTGTSIYGLNADEFSGLGGWCLRAFAVMQTQWAFGFEYHRVVNDYLNDRHKLQYIVGHGSFYRWDFLREYGFPMSADDIPLGYVITSQGGRIKPLPAVEVIGVALSVKDLLIQISNWYYHGLVMHRFKYYVDDVNFLAELNFRYEQFWTVLVWPVAPPLLVFALGWLAVTSPWIGIPAALAVLVVAQYSGVRTVRSVQTRVEDDVFQSVSHPWLLPHFLYPFLKSTGALLRLGLLFLNRVVSSDEVFRSTPK